MSLPLKEMSAKGRLVAGIDGDITLILFPGSIDDGAYSHSYWKYSMEKEILNTLYSLLCYDRRLASQSFTCSVVRVSQLR